MADGSVWCIANSRFPLEGIDMSTRAGSRGAGVRFRSKSTTRRYGSNSGVENTQTRTATKNGNTRGLARRTSVPFENSNSRRGERVNRSDPNNRNRSRSRNLKEAHEEGKVHEQTVKHQNNPLMRFLNTIKGVLGCGPRGCRSRRTHRGGNATRRNRRH